MDNTPLVSVLICTYNAERFIEKTVSSVLTQTYKNIELLILDNSSTDRTIVKLKKLAEQSQMAIHIVESKSNLGAHAGLNVLLDKSNGMYIAILDHDDLWHCEKICHQVDFLLKHPEYYGCGSQMYIWWEKTGGLSLFRASEVSTVSYHQTLMFRNVPEWRYDTKLKYRTDIHFMQKNLCSKGRRLYNFQKPLAVWRIRSDGKNLSRQWNSLKSLFEYWRHTGELFEALKGVIQLLMPTTVFNRLLRVRYSLAESNVGNPSLEGFPSPIGSECISEK